jgi:YVTN family beta-propeller protein
MLLEKFIRLPSAFCRLAPVVFMSATAGAVPNVAQGEVRHPFAYISTVDADAHIKLWTIDTTTNELGGSPIVLDGDFKSFEVAPDGRRLYFGHLPKADGATVSAFDVATGAVTPVASIPVGENGRPVQIAIALDGKRLYAVSDAAGGTFATIDAATNAVVRTIAGVGSAPTSPAVSPDGKYVFVASGEHVAKIDVQAHVLSAAISVGGPALGVALAPDGRHAYVVHKSTGQRGSAQSFLSVIETATNKVSAGPFATGFGNQIVVAPDGKHAYIANVRKAGFFVFDIAAQEARFVQGECHPGGDSVAVTPNGKQIFDAPSCGAAVRAWDAATNRLAAEITLPMPPGGNVTHIAIAPSPAGL